MIEPLQNVLTQLVSKLLCKLRTHICQRKLLSLGGDEEQCVGSAFVA